MDGATRVDPHTPAPTAVAAAAEPPSRVAVPARRARIRALAGSAGLTIAYTLLTVLFTWPIAPGLGSGTVAPVDPVATIWRVAWGQERLLHAPWALFQGNTFYPYARSYLFDELLFGSALLTLPLRLVTANPIAIYNAAVLLSFVLSALAMYALARRLGSGSAGAFAAGLIYAFAPLHIGHIGHLSLLSGQYFPLAILLLDRLFAAPRRRDALALAAVLAMQALSSQYYAFYLVPVVGGFILLRLLRDGWRRRLPGRAVWGRLALAGGLAALAVAPFALNYRAVQGDYGLERSIAQNAYYSANLASFLIADGQNWLWGRLTAPLRDHGARNLFPGLVALGLALLGALTHWRRPLAQYLVLLGLGSAILALGPGLYLTGDPKSLVFEPLPYRWPYYHVPGFDSMRVPARLGILVLLGVAGLAALGLSWLLARAAAWGQPRLSPRAPTAALAVLIIAAIGAESLNRPYRLHPLESGDRIPPVYGWLAAQPAATVAELPLLIPDHDREWRINARFQYFSLYHRHPTVNGAANVVPKGYKALFYEFRDGATPRALAILQGLGVSHVVVHYDLLSPTVAAKTRAALAAAPDQAREAAAFDASVVYRLAPTDRFARLRAAIPPGASIYLSREDPTGAYGGMLGRVLRDNPIYTRVRVEFGQGYAGSPEPGARYDYAILYAREDPAAAGFAGAAVIWQDADVRVYRRAGP